MNRLGLAIAGGLPAVLALFHAIPSPAAEAGLAPVLHDVGCKPEAPIVIEIQGSAANSRGSTRIDYALVPQLDVLRIEADFELPQGGRVQWHDSPQGSAAGRAEQRTGTARVILPESSKTGGADVVLVARVAISDPDAPGGVSWVSTSRTLTFGTVEREAEGVILVHGSDEPSLDIPAIHVVEGGR